jgi:outer membrane protein assembly factor BamA
MPTWRAIRGSLLLYVATLVTAFPAVALDVEVTGHDAFRAAEIETHLGFAALDTLTDGAARRGLDALAAHYADAGFWNASFRLIDGGDGGVMLHIEEGERVRTLGRRVIGAPRELEDRLDEQFESGAEVLDGERLGRELVGGLNTVADAGYPYASITATDFSLDEGVRYRVRVNAGARTRVDSLIVRGARLTRSRTIEQLAGFQPGRLYREQDRTRMRDRLERSELFSAVSEVGVIELEEGVAAYDIDITEAPTTRLLGVVGVGGVNGEVNGLVDVELTNLFGTARRLAAGWEGQGDERATYHLGVTEPWVLGWPIAVTGSFRQEQFDSTFTRTEWVGEISAELDDRFRVRFGLQSEETVTPFSAVRRATRESSRFGLTWDNQQTRRIRPSGARLELTATRGQQKDRFEEGSERRQVTTLESDMAVSVPIRGATGLFLATRGYVRDAPNEALRAEVLFPVGGAASLRGFEERRFRTGLGATLTTELRRYLAADGSRVGAFVDLAYLERSRTVGGGDSAWHGSVGAGFRVASRVGLVGLDLAASDEISAYGDIRLHLTYETRY